jgi:Heavy metal associated domain 2
MKYEVKMAHHVPGRVRVKVPAAIGDESVLESLKQAFAVLPGVDSVTVRPSSGSLILHYDPKLTTDIKSQFATWKHEQIIMTDPFPGDEIEEVARTIQAEAEFLAGHSKSARAAVDLFRKIDLQIRNSTGNEIDLKILVVAGLAVAAFIGIGMEASTPLWATLGLFVLNHFLEQHTALHSAGIK